jgi:hypothetical protein
MQEHPSALSAEQCRWLRASALCLGLKTAQPSSKWRCVSEKHNDRCRNTCPLSFDDAVRAVIAKRMSVPSFTPILQQATYKERLPVFSSLSLHQAATPFTPMSSQTVHDPPHPDKSATNKPDRCPKTRYGSWVLFHRAERKYLVLGNNPDHKHFCSAT